MPAIQNSRVEWWISHLRWVMLAVIFVLSSLDPAQSTNLFLIYWLLLAGAAYNSMVVLLLFFKSTPPYFQAITLVLDTLLLIAVTYLSGQPVYFLLALFPIIVAALQLGFEISLLITITITVAYGILIFFVAPWLVSGEVLLPTIVSILALFIGAIVGSVVSSKGRTLDMDIENKLPPSSAYRERFRAIYNMTGELIATLNYQLVLEMMLDVSLADFKEKARRSLQRPVSIVLFFNEEEDELYVAASRNLNKPDENQTVKGETGLVGQVISRAEPAMSNRPNADPELSNFSALRRCRSVLCVPLRAGLEIFGVAVFGHPEADIYSDVYMELVTAFCNQASIALQNAELYRNLQQEKKKILISDGELRKELARELHDGPTQTISSIAMRLDFIRMLMDKDPVKAKEELDNLERLAGQAVKEVRTMLFTMRPMILETQGLVAAIEQYAQRVEETDKIVIHLDTDKLDERPVPHVEVAIFLIIEEAVNNARKHADPQNIWINLARHDGELFAQVKDDGQGFDVEEVEDLYDERTSLGLVNMRERARLVNGVLTIKSGQGEGTTITLTAPMHGEKEPP